ncbi:Rho termination factor, N-terminal domain [Streptoalloteichus tenebrarius]|uniref:Rho termination factor, N-terminal domain n=1 Tax=Streptoalloteichus tenebrarius (strain ATCC 17920 / DSM 40477 / JCM 4838 / CBS 697.72 / NBRC 16177 / NCIMB 11028 / NRRL B-12390 / A12253. 1 / ISP 5477) TaxID=1933 RepID=A0ABT1HQC5_STRSD|nr:ChaB family protein [Streptoalloteichus tenebrarius]MCP2257692.1 Rho termination factor, N-terminal domain [Streptoalloteichus tenebrarius]
MPGREELPSTVERSPKKAQRTWIKAHDSAVETYGEGQRAHRVAFAALKHSFEKVGDHWEPKKEKGPSDPQAARGAKRKGGAKPGQAEVPRQRTEQGVDANASRDHLYKIAQKLDIRGRSTMSKDQLVEAIKKANARETAKARS